MPDVAFPQARAISVCIALVAANIGAWCGLFAIDSLYGAMLSPGILAYTYGLRHAVDADHIAAIDAATRRMAGEGRLPLLVGLWFSLGHATVVTVLCGVVAGASTWMRSHLDDARGVGAIIGTTVSATVLFLIGGLNLYTASALLQRWRAANKPGAHAEDGHEHEDGDDGHAHIVQVTDNAEVEGPGFILRCCPTLLKAMDQPWKMYPLGVLFGLGFDTSTEVAVLALAALSPQNNGPGVLVLILPVMFASSMALLDTLDGMLMLWSYSWALDKPKQRIFYNLFLTGITGIIAITVGLAETLGCIQSELELGGWFWDLIAAVNENFEYIGYAIVGFFAISTCIAVLLFKHYFGLEGTTVPRRGEDGFVIIEEPEEDDPSSTVVSDAAIKDLYRKSVFYTQQASSVDLGEQPLPVSPFEKVGIGDGIGYARDMPVAAAVPGMYSKVQTEEPAVALVQLPLRKVGDSEPPRAAATTGEDPCDLQPDDAIKRMYSRSRLTPKQVPDSEVLEQPEVDTSQKIDVECKQQ